MSFGWNLGSSIQFWKWVLGQVSPLTSLLIMSFTVSCTNEEWERSLKYYSLRDTWFKSTNKRTLLLLFPSHTVFSCCHCYFYYIVSVYIIHGCIIQKIYGISDSICTRQKCNQRFHIFHGQKTLVSEFYFVNLA